MTNKPQSDREGILDRPDVQAKLTSMRPRTVNSSIFNIAHAYARTADAAWRSLAETGDADFAGPAVICQSFAIELLLKSFAVAEHMNAAEGIVFVNMGIELRGHRCVALFDRLSDKSRSTLELAFAARRSSDMPNSFRDALATLGDDPFVRWRYVYEGSQSLGINKALLDCVTDPLGKSAESERRRLTAARRP